MPGRTRDEYLDLRRQYQPENIKLVIIAESPPDSGLYFYDRTGSPTKEPLFRAFMHQLQQLSSFTANKEDKEDGLREFQRRGLILVDATYKPVNKMNERDRDEEIRQAYKNLYDDLRNLMSYDFSIPLVLIKANVCRILESKLSQNGFKVLNAGHIIPFPSTGNQKKFEDQFGAILKPIGISV
jgi:hypothetical protein